MNDQDNVRTLVLLGTGGVGKSACVIRYITGNFVEEYDPTIEDCYRKSMPRAGGLDPVVLEIVDTAGQEGFSMLQDQWIRKGQGFVLVYAVNSRPSFAELHNYYSCIVQFQESADVPMVVVGNKCDLNHEVTTDQGRELAAEFGAQFFEASAKDGTNLDQVFQCAFELMLKKAGMPLHARATAASRGCCVIN